MAKPDTSSKKIINIYNQAWVEWLLQQQRVEVETELSGDFQFIARATDSLLQVNSPDGRFLVLTELQFRYDKTMPKRLAVYAFLARHKYDQPVYVVVVYFTPPPAGVTLVDAFQQEFRGQVARQDFQPVLLWELEAEQVLAYDNPVLVPFVPLMRGGDTEQMVRRCAERIRRESEALELETILSIFAGYVLETEVIKRILRWEMNVIKESPLVQELYQIGFEEGHQEGIEEGIELGERKAALDALYQTLGIRFKVERGRFDEALARLEAVSLKKLNETALTRPSLAAFEEALAEVLSAVDAASPGPDKG